MKTKLLWCLLILTFSSCISHHNDDEEINIDPPYHAKVVWRLDTPTLGGHHYGIQDDNHIYTYENAINVSGEFFLIKINLDTGEILWRSQNIPRAAYCNPVLADNKVFVLIGSNHIYCFDASNGYLLAIIQLGDQNHEYSINWGLTAYNNFLYLSFGRADTEYLARLNVIDSIDYDNAQTTQLLFPETLFESMWNSRVGPSPVIKDNIIYFMTYTGVNKKTTEFVAIRLDTKETVWERLIDDDDGSGHLLLNNNIIHIMGRKIVSANNISNGERIYTRSFPEDIFDDGYYAPGSSINSSRGSALYNNRFYYTNSNFNINGEYRAPNIVCLESSNGSTVWGRLAAPESFSMGVVPVVTNGKVFIPTDNGLEVIDAESGKLLGTDKKLKGYGAGIVFHYNDFIIFPCREDENYYRYIAVDISE